MLLLEDTEYFLVLEMQLLQGWLKNECGNGQMINLINTSMKG